MSLDTMRRFVSQGADASVTINTKLKKHNYRCRKAQKKKTMKSVAYRNAQFLKIKALVAEFRASCLIRITILSPSLGGTPLKQANSP
jgi:hypothetical protein